MDRFLIERIIVFSLLFVAIYKSTNKISEEKYNEAMREFIGIGLIPMSLHAAYRHMFQSGNIIKGGRFFEIEAGGANLGIAIASILAYFLNYSNQTMGAIVLIYAVYLLVSMITWLSFRPKGKNILLWGGQFLSIVSILSYYSYIGLTK
jgi:Na+/phosphate symporter